MFTYNFSQGINHGSKIYFIKKILKNNKKNNNQIKKLNLQILKIHNRLKNIQKKQFQILMLKFKIKIDQAKIICFKEYKKRDYQNLK
jgi:hypothetical protein